MRHLPIAKAGGQLAGMLFTRNLFEQPGTSWRASSIPSTNTFPTTARAVKVNRTPGKLAEHLGV